MPKDTTNIVNELYVCPDFKTFYNENKDYLIKEDLSSLLNNILKKHNLKKSQVVRAAEMSEVYAYQIFSGHRIPERKKLLCIAVAMQIGIDEVQTLLKAVAF